ncbi:NAD+ synthase (glutamine-hydrolysing) [Candidatus Planktophila sulfonica]|uniref:Glutamine-dependent NAD(+) synthetase n=1 Tax=Candidatus Planktophila sulfonica TaxID=1884904 RepID=A0A249KFR3_9ACTN|nr:NAD+ synthase [Candidatus Planktophila sulfonica]ASY15632.1 NAD+ synthase (glutamine-hydrolysing) [Candidatus Planktophila sulfonica]
MKLRLALAQINPTVGDLAGNAALIKQSVDQAVGAGAHIAIFPEMVLTGYPVEDLALRPSFQIASKTALSALASQLDKSIVSIVGYLDQVDGKPQNMVAVIAGGEVKARYAKCHLPNYGVFDEFRNFVAGDSTLVVRIHGVDVGIAICEDLWIDGGITAKLAARTPGLVIVPNGSPYERAKDDVRLSLVTKRAREAKAPLAYVNMTGGQDDLVFDGDSIVVNAEGAVIARAPQFEDGVMIVDVEAATGTSKPDVIISEDAVEIAKLSIPGIAHRLGDEEEMWNAIVVGLRDYVTKNGFKSVLVGLSGGIDSALVAALAVDALGPDRVFGVGMPSKYSSDHSIADAEAMAAHTGLAFRIVEIQKMVDTFRDQVELTGLAEENLQARVRGTTLMGLSNQEGHLVLATGNKSELACGYSTLYGDAVGGYAPIKDIYKTDVWALSRWRNQVAKEAGEVPPIPENSITKEPSAELRPDQKDSDSLPEYEILDQVLKAYVDDDLGRDALIAAGFDKELVMRVIAMVDKAEYKRRQYPPGTKVSKRAFGKDRRLPMTSKWREL